jgi:hypothetical protein
MISAGYRNPLYDGAPVPTSPAPSTLYPTDPPILPATAPPPKLTMPLVEVLRASNPSQPNIVTEIRYSSQNSTARDYVMLTWSE